MPAERPGPDRAHDAAARREARSRSRLGSDRIHLLAEITTAAYHARDAYLTDPLHGPVAVEHFLADAWADRILPHIDRAQAKRPLYWDDVAHTDTVCLSVVDRDRNAVSFINSIFNSFGSGIYVPASGILLHNRGLSFASAPAHPNSIARASGRCTRSSRAWCAATAAP